MMELFKNQISKSRISKSVVVTSVQYAFFSMTAVNEGPYCTGNTEMSLEILYMQAPLFYLLQEQVDKVRNRSYFVNVDIFTICIIIYVLSYALSPVICPEFKIMFCVFYFGSCVAVQTFVYWEQ